MKEEELNKEIFRALKKKDKIDKIIDRYRNLIGEKKWKKLIKEEKYKGVRKLFRGFIFGENK